MTLQAPEHLRGDMRDRPAHIREERRQWVASATSQGISRVRIQKALGIFQAPPQTRPKRDRKGLLPLEAPQHLTGRMSRWTPQATRDERTTWAMDQAAKGYCSTDIAAALGIAQQNAWQILADAGWDAWAEQRAKARGDAA